MKSLSCTLSQTRPMHGDCWWPNPLGLAGLPHQTEAGEGPGRWASPSPVFPRKDAQTGLPLCPALPCRPVLPDLRMQASAYQRWVGTPGRPWLSAKGSQNKGIRGKRKSLLIFGPHSRFDTWPISAFSELTDSGRRKEGRETSCALEIYCPEPPTKTELI